MHGRAITVAEHGLAHARRVSSRVGSARVLVLLAGECERVGDVARAGTYRAAAVEELRALGDRRTTAELLMTIVSPSRTLSRIPAPALTEARELASEIGWHEGLASGGES